MIEVKKVRKSFFDKEKETKVLEEISFYVEEGKFVSIIGPIGCGKTTLLNIIAGLEKPDSGEVHLGNEKIKKPRLGIIFQDFILFPWKTIAENIKLFLKVKGVKENEVEILSRKILEKMGLSGYFNFYPLQLSGGLRQKANFSALLALDPDIWLMDEPFSALDLQTRYLMQEELLKIWEKNKKTVLFVTHNIEEALFLSDRVLIFSSSPTRIITEIELNFSRPRQLMQLKKTQNFIEVENEIRKILKKEILKKVIS